MQRYIGVYGYNKQDLNLTRVKGWDSMISIITATYNRRNTIGRLYKSLLEQTNKNFQWIVVDDGSTDNTKELIEEYIKENKINIIYRYKENGGKHTAVNVGLKFAEGNMITFVDSDDYMTPQAVEFYESNYEKIKDKDDFMGISGIKVYENGQVIGHSQEKSIEATYFDFRYKMNIDGDRAEAFKREELINYSFPEFQGEKFVTEALLYNRVCSSNKKIIWGTEAVVVCEYCEDGLTAQGLNLFLKSWNGYSLYVKEFAMHKEIPLKKRARLFLAYFYKGIKARKNIFTIFKVR